MNKTVNPKRLDRQGEADKINLFLHSCICKINCKLTKILRSMPTAIVIYTWNRIQIIFKAIFILKTILHYFYNMVQKIGRC